LHTENMTGVVVEPL